MAFYDVCISRIWNSRADHLAFTIIARLLNVLRSLHHEPVGSPKKLFAVMVASFSISC
jgi:hypothetical protein